MHIALAKVPESCISHYVLSRKYQAQHFYLASWWLYIYLVLHFRFSFQFTLSLFIFLQDVHRKCFGYSIVSLTKLFINASLTLLLFLVLFRNNRVCLFYLSMHSYKQRWQTVSSQFRVCNEFHPVILCSFYLRYYS